MTTLSYVSLHHLHHDEGALAEWSIADFLPDGSITDAGEFILQLTEQGVRLCAHTDGAQALRVFTDTRALDLLESAQTIADVEAALQEAGIRRQEQTR